MEGSFGLLMRVHGRAVAGVVVLATLSVVVACGSEHAPVPGSHHRGADQAIRTVPATVVATYPHDPASFTEGLVFVDREHLAESSGGYGTSSVRIYNPVSGAVHATRANDPAVFAEGLGHHGGTLVQLTWKEGRAFRWGSNDLAVGDHYEFTGEGWGLTYDARAKRWVQSDGSSRLILRDPTTFAPVGRIDVTEAGRPVQQLNELEVVDDTIWANVWMSDRIVAIDRHSGRVTKSVTLASINPNLANPEAVLNGIAHRPGDPPNRLWVTGKLWSNLYEVEIP